MDTSTDGEPKLDDVLLFNDYLLKLADAGIPVSLDGNGVNEELLEKLSKINSMFAMSVARGSTVRQVVETAPGVPVAYRCALMQWLYCGRTPEALETLSEVGIGRSRRERIMQSALLNPLILLGIAFLGFLLWMVFVGPNLKSLSVQIGAKPGVGLQFLELARQTAWLWGIGIPVLVCLALLAWFQMRSRMRFGWIPGRRNIDNSVMLAGHAAGLGNMMQHNFSVKQANEAIGPVAIHSVKTNSMLDWALGTEMTDGERANALAATAKAYRVLARWRAMRVEYWFPAILGALFGGVIVLAYGLSLFEPLIELLTSITQL